MSLPLTGQEVSRAECAAACCLEPHQHLVAQVQPLLLAVKVQHVVQPLALRAAGEVLPGMRVRRGASWCSLALLLGHRTTHMSQLLAAMQGCQYHTTQLMHCAVMPARPGIAASAVGAATPEPPP